MNKPKVAIVRGAFLNRYEMQFYEPLEKQFDLTAFSSLHPIHDELKFPVIKLPCPMDLPDFPYKMPILNRLFTDAHYLWGLERRLNGYDLVHTAETYYRYTQQALDAKKQGWVTKVIATVLENIPFNNEGIWGRKMFKNRSRSQLDHIIALTEKTRTVLLREGTDPEKITVISHFIDTKRFLPVNKWINPDDRTKPLTVLFCGRLETNKGVYDILETARLLLNGQRLKGFKINFTMVGDGHERKNLINQMEKYGLGKYFTFEHKSYDEMPEAYRQADIYLAPSIPTPTWEEQYNTTLLEAQAAGLPIVTTRTGGIPENVGNAAIICDPGSPEQLARALTGLVTDPKLRQKYALAARKRAVEVHDIQIGAGKLAAVYEKVLKQ